jgi:hypothetical protein
MNTLVLDSPSTVVPAWRAALDRAGFVTAEGGFRCGDFRLVREEEWWVVQAPAAEGPLDFLRDQANQPGLWKWLQKDGTWWRVFELPAGLAQALPEEESSGELLSAALQWALATVGGSVPAGWQAPAREMVLDWCGTKPLTIQAEGLLCQGELILTDRCWAFRFPVLPQLPVAWPKKREKTFQHFLRSSQQEWGMARWAACGEGGAAGLYAQVDLTGAPPAGALVSAGLDGCRFFIQSFAETAALLADLRVEIAALAGG